jgi:hypothetical protein
MATLLWLPGCERDPHGRALPWAETSDPKGCLHTTEGSGWPPYQGWTVHPHFTVLPLPGRGVRVKQHVRLDGASFALRNTPGGVETNRDRVYQVELIGTATRNGPGLAWRDADDVVLAALYRTLIRPLSEEVGIPLSALPFRDEAAVPGHRLGGARFDGYSGWLGHQHVPENSHWDPGPFPWDRMIKVGDDDMPLTVEDKAWIRGELATATRKAAEDAWAAELIKAPAREPDPITNKTWQPRSFPGLILDGIDELRQRQAPTPTVDVPKLAEALAAALAARLPAGAGVDVDAHELAAAVVDEFTDRLTT